MGFHHLPSEYFWVAVLIGALLVWLFNSYRLGKFQGKKRAIPWVICGLLVIVAPLVLFLSGCSPQNEPLEVAETISISQSSKNQ